MRDLISIVLAIGGFILMLGGAGYYSAGNPLGQACIPMIIGAMMCYIGGRIGKVTQ